MKDCIFALHQVGVELGVDGKVREAKGEWWCQWQSGRSRTTSSTVALRCRRWIALRRFRWVELRARKGRIMVAFPSATGPRPLPGTQGGVREWGQPQLPGMALAWRVRWAGALMNRAVSPGHQFNLHRRHYLHLLLCRNRCSRLFHRHPHPLRFSPCPHGRHPGPLQPRDHAFHALQFCRAESLASRLPHLWRGVGSSPGSASGQQQPSLGQEPWIGVIQGQSWGVEF
jgi:hypothetical protein